MYANARKEKFEAVKLFGKPALFSNSRIQHDSVPERFYQYDLRGSDNDPGRPVSVADHVGVNHAGTVLTTTPVKYPKGKNYLSIRGRIDFAGQKLSLDEFCRQQGLPVPATPEYELCPASPDEAGLFYAQTPEKDAELEAIGHVRIDFGSSGKEFWHTWWPRGPEELNSPEFKAELGKVVDTLRKTVLKDSDSMKRYCHEHGGAIEGGWRQNYGYVVDTGRYQFYLRCNPGRGDYNAYLTCLDKQAQKLSQESEVIGRLSFASGEVLEYTSGEQYIEALKEELEYMAATGMKYETLTDDPAVRKAVDDVLYNFAGEENSRPLEDYENTPSEGIIMGGMS